MWRHLFKVMILKWCNVSWQCLLKIHLSRSLVVSLKILMLDAILFFLNTGKSWWGPILIFNFCKVILWYRLCFDSHMKMADFCAKNVEMWRFLFWYEWLQLLSCFSFSPDKSKSVTICEGKKATLTCKKGRKISIVKANYGRLNKRTCNKGPIRSTNCKAAKSVALVRNTCHGKARCVLSASNSVFGDPCGGTYKYLAVKYKCGR